MVATNGRIRVEPQWPNGGMVSRPMGDRNWELQQLTAAPVSTVPQGRWDRGVLYRGATPVFKSSQLGLYMYDPTATIYEDKQWRPRLFNRKKGKG